MPFSINLPSRNGSGGESELIEAYGNIVIIGANGSGKTRFGVWLESSNRDQYEIHRVSAQKALAIPDFAQLKNIEQAAQDLFLGRSDQHASRNRIMDYRWGGNPATFLLQDYDRLLSLLFAKSAERDRQHVEETRECGCYVPVNDAPIDTIIKVWGDFMPHREIRFNDGKVLVNKTGESEYHGKEMSDGERVALYMMGICLCAPDNSIIIIDEPEIHLHTAIVDKLWNKVEGLSQSKLIVYITHDLDFAASRVDAKKFWIQSYSGTNAWKWNEIPEDESLTEGMILEIIGSRKKILFCEGTSGSLDASLYQVVYSDYHVIPSGNCTKVIESTKALRNNVRLHHMEAIGFIDSDYREGEEIASLAKHGVYTISIAEIENLLCTEPVIRVVAANLGFDPDTVVGQVKDYIIDALKSELETQISSMAEKRVQYRLSAYASSSKSKAGLHNALAATLSGIDIDAIYDECKSAFEAAIASNDLEQLLRIYNRKSLPDRISGIFELSKGSYVSLSMRLLKGPQGPVLIEALRKCLPILTVDR